MLTFCICVYLSAGSSQLVSHCYWTFGMNKYHNNNNKCFPVFRILLLVVVTVLLLIFFSISIISIYSIM